MQSSGLPQDHPHVPPSPRLSTDELAHAYGLCCLGSAPTKADGNQESGVTMSFRQSLHSPRTTAVSITTFVPPVSSSLFVLQTEGLLRATKTALLAAGVRALRVTTCDSSAQIRTKAMALTKPSEPTDVLARGVGMVECMMAMPSFADLVASGSGLGPSPTLSLVPDFGTLQVLPYRPSHANVYGFLCNNDIAGTGEMQLSDVCPRWCLKRSIEALADAGLAVQIGVEIEFVLERKQDNGEWVPVDEDLWCSSSSIDQPQVADFLDEIGQVLVKQGVQVDQVHAESCHGQFEIVLSHCNCPIKMADSILTTRQSLRAIAGLHNMRVRLDPKPSAVEAGNGMHVHLSVHSKSFFMPEQRSHFMAGILHHLPGLVAITTPSEDSFRRIQPGCWAGAFCCWGVDNKEAALRLCDGGRHFEVKTVDSSCNPYLAFAVLLSAGQDGVQQQLDLPSPIQGNPAVDAMKPERLPTSLSSAVDALQSDTILMDTLGTRLARAYVAVKHEEISFGAKQNKTQ